MSPRGLTPDGRAAPPVSVDAGSSPSPRLDLHPWLPPEERAAPSPANLAANSTLPNALVDAACASGGNAEVESAFDPSAGVLYDTWIGCGGIGFARSLDHGFSFQTAMAVLGSTNGSSWDPSIAVAPNGTVYVGYMFQNGSGIMPRVAWSYDRGSSFNGSSTAFLPNAQEFGDRDFLAVAPNGTLYLTWDYSPNSSLDQIRCATGGSCYFIAGDYNIVVVRSSDGGRNWSDPVPVSSGYPDGGAPCGPLLVEPSGAVDVLYEGYQVTIVNPASHLLGAGLNYFARSVDGGRTFSTPRAISNLTFPTTSWWIDGAIARDASGTLYATFDAQNGTNDTAYVALSQDLGTTWSAPIPLNPDVDSAPHIMAEAAGGGNGTAYLAWMSNNSTSGWSVFEAVLSGNGTVLSGPTVLSDQFGTDGYWVGDTIGVSYLGRGEVAVSWTYAVTLNGTLASQIFSATVGEPLPGAPTITSLVPGRGSVLVRWNPPTSGGPADAYEVTWAIEGYHPTSMNVSGAARSATITGLVANARYLLNVAAVDGAGRGPFGPAVPLVLTAWGGLTGTVVPTDARVALDHVPLAVASDGSFAANTTMGSHLLTAIATGFLPAADSVNLPWNASVRASLQLDPAPGNVTGYVDPPSASLSWDGAILPVALNGSFRIGGLAGSVHTIAASLLGYLPATLVVAVPQNATLWSNITLAMRNGTVTLEVDPANANVSLSGVPVPLDSRGFANVSRPPGTYTLDAQAPGYLPWSENLTLTSFGQSVRVNLTPSQGRESPGSHGPYLPTWEYILGALAVLLVIIALVVAIGRTRRKGTAPLAAPDEGDELYGTERPARDDPPDGEAP